MMVCMALNIFQGSNTSDSSGGHAAGLSHAVDSHGYASHGSSPFSFQHVSPSRGYAGKLPARDYPQSKVHNYVEALSEHRIHSIFSFRFLLTLQTAVPLDNLVPGHSSTDYYLYTNLGANLNAKTRQDLCMQVCCNHELASVGGRCR